MRTSSWVSWTGVVAALSICTVLLSEPNRAGAASGTWTESTGDGLWSSGGNWSGGVIADGADNTADLSMVDLDPLAVNSQFPGFFRNAIQVDTARTIGNMVFGDSNASTPGGWQVYTLDPTNNILTLAGASPTITVNPLGPFDTVPFGGSEVIDDAWFSNVNLSGTSGFTKAGSGVLTLAGTANTLSGNINVNAGTLRLPSTFVNTGAAPYILANGTTLDVDVVTIGGVSVAAGATATLRAGVTANNFMQNVTGAGAGMGSVLNLELAGTGARTYTPEQSWTGFDALNVTGTAEGTPPPDLRFRPNSTAGFDTNSFATTAVNLDNVRIYWRTSGAGGGNGNDINIGSLSGTSTAIVDGGGFGGGVTPARYHIGALGTDTVFAGTIQNSGTVAGPDPDTGSILIEKVGTGKLTLSGTLTYTTAAIADPVLRGGVTRVTAGTLAVSGTAAIPGGITDDTLGNLYTTIDVRAGAFFDVSGASSTYSTAPLQQVLGTGTIVGNYNHDEGRIRAADVPIGNGNIPTPTAGTITFANDLSFAGSGEIIYDMAESPATGNDLIMVNGTTNLTGSTTAVTPNFIGGVTPTSGTYTILNSTGGINGLPTGWTVAWPGRGAGPTVVANGNFLQFTAVPVVGDANLNWTGTSGSNWDVNATVNWRNNDTNMNDKYFNDDNVTFADTHTGGTPVANFSVSLVANVAPRSVTVDSTNNYTFAGTGVITGTSTFTKRGASTLVMQKANTFSGAAAVEAGTVDVGNFNGALGTGVLTLKGATIFGAMNGLTNSALVIESGNNTIQSNHGSFVVLPALSGSGNLTVTSTDDNLRVDLANAVNNFTGNLTFSPDGVTGTAMTVRVAGAVNDLAGASVTLGNGAVMANRNGSSTVVPIEIGALSGSSTTALQPFSGGGSSPGTNWQIGGLNASTEFAGVIRDNVNAEMVITAVSSLTKQGAGTLTLSGPNTYTGDTTVSDGELSLSTPYLANGADVFLTTGALLNLTHSDTDVIDSLFFNGVSQAEGTWGSPTSSATHKSDFFSGSGLLQVTTFVAPPLLIGDYNSNGIVDAADYTVWRNALGTSTVLNNRDPLNMGNVSQDDYASWKGNFGATLMGAGSLNSSGSVPEPVSLVLMLMMGGGLWGAGPRRR